MVQREAAFGCGEVLTPDVAVRLTEAADRFRASLHLECGGKRVRLDSLIGILALDCRQGTRLAVIADGADERSAAEAIAALLEGRA